MWLSIFLFIMGCNRSTRMEAALTWVKRRTLAPSCWRGHIPLSCTIFLRCIKSWEQEPTRTEFQSWPSSIANVPHVKINIYNSDPTEVTFVRTRDPVRRLVPAHSHGPWPTVSGSCPDTSEEQDTHGAHFRSPVSGKRSLWPWGGTRDGSEATRAAFLSEWAHQPGVWPTRSNKHVKTFKGIWWIYQR